jgi:hypothetical protein
MVKGSGDLGPFQQRQQDLVATNGCLKSAEGAPDRLGNAEIHMMTVR